MGKQEFNKLVRDKEPEIIERNKKYSLTKALYDEEFLTALNEKLIEEANEVINAKTKGEITEELADLLEVMLAKANIKYITLEDILKAREEKKAKKGGFDDKIFLINTIDQKYIDENKGCLLCANGSCKIPYKEKNGYEDDGKPAGHYCLGFISCYKRR